MLASALRLPARCLPLWSASTCLALARWQRPHVGAPGVGAPRGLDAVAEVAKQLEADTTALRGGGGARSALLADDRHHQTHRYKARPGSAGIELGMRLSLQLTLCAGVVPVAPLCKCRSRCTSRRRLQMTSTARRFDAHG